ncbi:HAD-like protein [Basidiobolus meristosporus CBS 931.73]|uniref:HAD-like protein n=1 Tax=Basidiobolus meristosporus CBS 931.73 TaxID=1314790 RepID=A0A1Y1YN33_9FUNG|nr:HAD-like protein [Basidiobolus meristosporus CBS 931.73]|eukprot:ORX99447.1 HAD-like protein [Basidiobolus meristosporus CBS 931.73]
MSTGLATQKRILSYAPCSTKVEALLERKRIRGLVFDMDGTLVYPITPFLREMRVQLKVPEGMDILTHLHSLEGPARERGEQIIKDLEAQALLEMKVQPGLEKLIQFLEDHSLPKAILTRNNPTTVDHFLAQTNLNFETVVTREFRPPKPSPAPLLHIVNQWEVEPEEVFMIGDHSDDLECGAKAGALTILLRNDINGHFAEMADFVVDQLDEIIPIIQNGFHVEK